MNDLLIAGQTDVGQRRQDNQDAFICKTLWSASSALLVVIDGVGGYAGGDRAATIASESIEQYMATPNGDPLSMLREAVVFANNQINEQRQQDLRLGQMCCVLTAVLADVRIGKLVFVHVGDTRLYRYRQGALLKLTHDHSLVGVREDARELTEAEAMNHPRRNEILREVGSTAHRVDDPDFLESDETDFLPGDQLLLCSDGLTDMITQAQIKAVLDRPISLKEQAAELIRIANNQGGNDNISVVLARNNTQISDSSALTTDIKPDLIPAPNVSGVTISPEIPAGETIPQPAKRSSTGWWVALAITLVSLVAGLLWYQSWPVSESRLPTATDSLKTTGFQPDITSVPTRKPLRVDSLLQAAHQRPDHRLVLTDDTLRIDQPLILTDSLLSIIGSDHLTVIIPTDSAAAQVAVRVNHQGAVTLSNLVISRFRTGIETTGAVQLQLNKIYFTQVNLPIRAAVRQDTCLNTVLSVAVQNQSVPSKPLNH